MSEYEPLSPLTWPELQAARSRDNPEELARAVVSAALYLDDLALATVFCVEFAGHRDPIVRGNALLGFAHLARLHGALDRRRTLPLVQRGLRDSHDWVRMQARNAADDIIHYLGWTDLEPAT